MKDQPNSDELFPKKEIGIGIDAACWQGIPDEFIEFVRQHAFFAPLSGEPNMGNGE